MKMNQVLRVMVSLSDYAFKAMRNGKRLVDFNTYACSMGFQHGQVLKTGSPNLHPNSDITVTTQGP